MKFSQLCVAGALTLEVLSRGVNFASALKHDASKETTTTHLMRKETQVVKNKEMKESFMASHGHRALDANLNWERSAVNLYNTTTDCYERGLSMSGDGKSFAIACKEDNSNTGKVKIYSLEDGKWNQKGEDIVGQGEWDLLGSSVALSGEGSILAIGIMGRSTGSKSNNGCIQVYEYKNGVWTPMGEQIEGQNDKEYFGEEVSLSADGNILAGSGNLSNNGEEGFGFVRTFQIVEENWIQLGQNNNDQPGHSLSLSENGQVMALGSPNTDNGLTDSGSFSVYQYDNINDRWVPIGYTINGDTAHSQLGISIQISCDASTVIVGSYWGKYAIVYRYNENEDQWKQIGEKLSPTTDIFGVGIAVSISKDGSIILVPNPYEDTNKGVVRAYKYSGSQWNQLGQDIYGTTDYDYFGDAAVLSADGNTLVAASAKTGASVYTLSVVEEWDGSWYITYDTANLTDGVLTSTYITKPGVNASANVTVAHTDGTCASGGETHDKSVITTTTSTVTVVDDTIDDTLDVAKTLDAAVIASSHNGTFLFCETVTLTSNGLNIVDVQTEYTVKANFLATFGTYNVTLVDDSSVITVDEQTMSVDGTVVVARCDGATDSINQGDILCLEISETDSASVGVQSIYNLDLEQETSTSTFIAIDDGEIKYIDLVDVDCATAPGTCKVNVVVPDTLFVNDDPDSDATTFTLNISGDVYLYKMNGKDSESEPKGFGISVKLEKPCEGGFLRGVAEMLFNSE